MSLAPRFGSPADFSLLFADDSSNRTDYVLGTILVGAVLFGFFLLWMLLLGLFTCLGTQRVGFLAGSPMAPREMGDEGVSMEVEPPKNEDSENGNNPKPYRGTRVGVVRFIFLLSCISVITVSVLSIYVRGFNDLKDSSDDAKSIVEMFHQNATTGEIMVRDMILESNDFQGKRDIIVDELDSDSFCPDPNLDTLTGQPINVLREELIQTLSSLNDFEQKNLDTLQKLGFDKVRLNTYALTYVPAHMISKNFLYSKHYISPLFADEIPKSNHKNVFEHCGSSKMGNAGFYVYILCNIILYDAGNYPIMVRETDTCTEVF